MKLIKPTLKYEKSWKKMLNEFDEEGTTGFWFVDKRPTNLNEYIERVENHSKGKDLPDYWVQATTYWLIDNDQLIGHTNVRHKLTPKLEKIGGHIGYMIRPKYREKGYGYKILELALKKARDLGLKKVLITCYDDNIASQKIIEKNKGELKDKVTFEEKLVHHYWIEIE